MFDWNLHHTWSLPPLGAEGAFLFEKLASLSQAEQDLVCLGRIPPKTVL